MSVRKILVLSLMVSSVMGCAGGEAPDQSPTSSNAAPIAAEVSPGGASTMAQSTMTQKATTRSGSFVSGEHPTEGNAQLVTQGGKTVVQLDQGFKTSEMGPDLVVILHRSNNVIGSTTPPAFPLKEGDYIILAPLKKFSGAQEYPVPATAKLANYNSVAIWCRKFNATFGAASLN